MAGGKKKQIVLTDEQKYEKYSRQMESVPCLLSKMEQQRIYKGLAKDFAALGEYEDANEQAAKCSKMAEELAGAVETEKKCVKEKETADKEEKEREELERKGGKGRYVFLIIIVLIGLAIGAYKFGPTRYYIAGMQNAVGLQKMAIHSYHVLGDYKDSKDKELAAAYRYAESLKKDGKLKQARAEYAVLAKKEYKDSGKKTVELEKELLKKSKVGKQVTIGKKSWIVAEIQNQTYTLVQSSILKKQPFHKDGNEVSWETSSLRAYLNGEYLQKKFVKEEQEIIDTTNVESNHNAKYSVSAGNATKDKLYILSADEFNKYAEILKTKSNNMRLRTPGKTKDATVYTSFIGNVVYYGFPAERDDLWVRPVMKITL